MIEHQFRTRPFKHQRQTFAETCELPMYALLWEPGTGKTKLVIDTAAYLYKQGKIDALVVVAPNGVHRNWITDELPKHMPEDIESGMFAHFYQTGSASTKWHTNACKRLLSHPHLSILAISYDSVMTEKGRRLLWNMLQKRKVLYVLDESHMIKSVGAKRTKRIVASGKYAAYRRILTGTPVSQGPMDLFPQFKFLDPEFWDRHGLGQFLSFKHYFAEWVQMQVDGRRYDKLVGYRRLNELKAMIDPFSSRVLKEDVLDLPPKLYSKLYFDMTAEQKRVYNDLRSETIHYLESGGYVEADIVLVLLLRLQQVTCGYVPVTLDPTVDEPPILKDIGPENPRLKATVEYCKTLEHPAIIWARFSRDIDLLMEALGDEAVRYDGQISDDAAAESKDRFQNGEAKFFVGNPQKGGTGLTLTRARTVIYYSNGRKLIDRLQSEDRPHRIGQEHPVHYLDVIAPGTIDEAIVKRLREHWDVATQITGDELRTWI